MRISWIYKKDLRKALGEKPTKEGAAKACLRLAGFRPSAVVAIDDGSGGKGWMCFESWDDYDIWRKQK